MARKKAFSIKDDVSGQDIMDSALDHPPVRLTPINVWIPTGVCLLTWALGTPGWPGGRFIELYGPEGVTKTGLALLAGRENILQGGTTAYIDCEHSLTKGRLPLLGYPVDSEGELINFIYSAPFSLEEVHRTIEALVNNHAKLDNPLFIIWDSYTAAGPKKSQKRILEEKSNVADSARLNSEWFHSGILGAIDGKPIVIMVINQIRDTLDVFNPAKKTASTGGRALKYYASMRVEITSPGQIQPSTKGNNVPGIYVNAKITKNRFAPSHRQANFPFNFERGVDDLQTLIRYAKMKGVLKKNDSGLLLYNDQYMSGPKLWAHLKENADELQTLADQCKAAYNQVTPFTMNFDDDSATDE